MVPSRCSPIEIANCGMPCRKLVVPSSGSTMQHLFGAPVGHGDEIGRPLQRNLKVLDLAEIALETAAGVARGFDHDVDKG
jgi:hypothetical protein